MHGHFRLLSSIPYLFSFPFPWSQPPCIIITACIIIQPSKIAHVRNVVSFHLNIDFPTMRTITGTTHAAIIRKKWFPRCQACPAIILWLVGRILNTLLRTPQEVSFITFKKQIPLYRRMGTALIVPSWFFGYNIILEFVFALITLFVSIYAFKVYRLSAQRTALHFGIGFGCFSLAYLLQSALNFSILLKVNQSMCPMVKANLISYLDQIGLLFYVFLFTAGLLALAALSLKIKNTEIFSLLSVITFVALIFSSNKLFLFYLLSSILLVYITFYYLRQYLKHRQKSSLLVVSAFAFLLFGRIHFIFALDHGTYYVIGHLLELVAYGLIFINLYGIIRKK